MNEEIKKMFRRIEIDKLNDSCGFEFADGFDCTFDNIATCYDDRLKLYDLVKELQQENNQLKEKCEKQQYAITENCDLRLRIEQLEQQRDFNKELLTKFAKKDRVLKELRSWLENKDNCGYEKIYLEDILIMLNELDGKNAN